MAVKNEWAERDYYADLGVSSQASEGDIKRAYRKLARDNHPDSHPGDTVREERFKKVAQAYDVLGDEEKRKEYDDFRTMLKNGGGFGGGFPTGGGFRAHDFDLSDLFGRGGAAGATGGFGDIFGSAFGGGAGHRNPTRQTRGSDVETEVTIEFREAAKGTTFPIQLTGNAPCAACHGSGSQTGEVSTCPTCHGSGFKSENRGAFGFSAPCTDCGGDGKKINDPCSACRSTGTVRRSRSITVRIPAGVEDGQKVRLAGQGEAGPHGLPAGDLFVHVHVKQDPLFKRKGLDLEVKVPVSFAELSLGDTISVPTLDSPVTLKIPAGTPNGRVLRVRGRGISRRNGDTGDLRVKLDLVVPTSLDSEALAALQQYALAEQKSGFDPRANWAGHTH
ncbi:molecular chaperone DnaJ [Corynebacterium sp. ES2794-CONJ1]|uniref:molecular chaperone DnaJ n=1 Tax=unclassified Corynebacterium TaxID=2624378 RepID=UPI002168D9FB|nr:MULTISPECIES: molecular chaperone DnaJ [unclassified Corynebacterium]MCS4490179.1 molecular chaperone DnaJ [Corynebacterium sp. ES2775-CONJ]MCS4492010.1 molecular chaperone DnaJ [Corynebacterium sp. ES2715-CONJ3]MCS4532114.1 molecular chaperone DnaJ [Corynebacterium sp. ES2730-CONJ]MCU9519516.1 molecular chaperone DnaJ [Corynebacterium sp. ES2794-CONJ1]